MFGHHSGVFLNSEEPAELHIHTIVRTPNRGDMVMFSESDELLQELSK
jgi:hypothetical protein